TRLFLEENKLNFRVYDYTDATSLLGEEFITVPPKTPADDDESDSQPPTVGESGDVYVTSAAIEVVGFDVVVTPFGRYIVSQVDGRDRLVSVEEYEQQVAEKLLHAAPDLPSFRNQWIERDARQALLRQLPAEGQSALLLRSLKEMVDYDLYDVLVEVGYGLAPRTLTERAEAFAYKQSTWLNTMPPDAAATIAAIVAQFERGGTEELENRLIWRVPEVSLSGGMKALAALGKPADILHDTKARVFAA
ncbi:MAG: type I restriction-modification enzyme R subunit C-terminal domain-containing protein, partial [Caldilineaceae bacterium]